MIDPADSRRSEAVSAEPPAWEALVAQFAMPGTSAADIHARTSFHDDDPEVGRDSGRC